MNRPLACVAIVSVLAVAACSSPGASGPGTLAGDSASPAPNTSATVGTAASRGVPDVATDFPPACDVLA